MHLLVFLKKKKKVNGWTLSSLAILPWIPLLHMITSGVFSPEESLTMPRICASQHPVSGIPVNCQSRDSSSPHFFQCLPSQYLRIDYNQLLIWLHLKVIFSWLLLIFNAFSLLEYLNTTIRLPGQTRSVKDVYLVHYKLQVITLIETLLLVWPGYSNSFNLKNNPTRCTLSLSLQMRKLGLGEKSDFLMLSQLVTRETTWTCPMPKPT